MDQISSSLEGKTEENEPQDPLNGLWLGSSASTSLPFNYSLSLFKMKGPTNPIFWSLAFFNPESEKDLNVVGGGYTPVEGILQPFGLWGKFDRESKSITLKKKYLTQYSTIEVHFSGKIINNAEDQPLIEGTWVNENSQYSGTFKCTKQKNFKPSSPSSDDPANPKQFVKLFEQFTTSLSSLCLPDIEEWRSTEGRQTQC
jgi:hypothetical protein